MLIELRNAGFPVWIPMFADADFFRQEKMLHIAAIFWSMELLQIMFSFAFHWALVLEMTRHKLFHYNFLVLVSSAFVLYQVSMLARVVLFLIQINMLDKTEFTAEILLQAAGFFRIYFLTFGVLLLACVMVERCFSTYHLRDYEAFKRPWISWIPLIINLLLSTIVGVAAVYLSPRHEIYVYPPTVLFLLIVCGSTLTAHVTLYYRNDRFMRQLNKSWRFDQYTLSTRFQLQENIKALKIIGVFIITTGIFIFCAAIIYTVALYLREFSNASSQIVCCFLEMSCAVFINSFSLAALRVFPKMRTSILAHYLRILNVFLRRRRNASSNSSNNKNSMADINRKWSVPTDEQTNTYFSQLETSWERQLTRKHRKTHPI